MFYKDEEDTIVLCLMAHICLFSTKLNSGLP